MTNTNQQHKHHHPLPFPCCPDGGCGWYAVSNLFNTDFRRVSEFGVNFGELSGELYRDNNIYIETVLASNKPIQSSKVNDILHKLPPTPNQQYTPLIFDVKTKKGRHCVGAIYKNQSNLLIIIDPAKTHTTSTTPTKYFKKNEVWKLGVFMGGVGMIASFEEEGVKHLLG